jgi:carotenoid cleavage dioxygenase-like enzyme
MAAEEAAGRALFGGIMTPAFVDQELLGPDPDPGWPTRLDPFINIVRHAGRLLALSEGLPPYELGPDLTTVGRYDFAGALPGGMCAHPKIDPVTGEMIVFRYDVEEPYLTWAVVDAAGAVVRASTPVPGIERCHMVHDAVITEHLLVLILGPAILDVDTMFSGGEVLQWRPELGTRIVAIPRDGSGPVRSFDTDAFWVWHFANAYEEEGTDNRIVCDFPWWSTLGAFDRGAPVRGAFTRATIDVAAGRVALAHVDELASEFPRIDDRRTGRRHRFLTVGRSSGRPGLVAGEHDQLVRYDMDAGTSVLYDCEATIDEVVFAPRQGGLDELDGYYLGFTSSIGTERSSALWIWDAAEFPSEPVARIRMPRRVPHGLHGSWLAAL